MSSPNALTSTNNDQQSVCSTNLDSGAATPNPGPNPFSPPESVISFSMNANTSSALSSPGASVTEFPRLNSFGSRPEASRASSGLRMREAFTPPAQRPITAYTSAVAPKAARPRSTMLREDQPLNKPWLEKTAKDPYFRYAYWITYATIFLGIVGSAIRIYFGYASVQMLTSSDLCEVLNEDFSGSEADLFADGRWTREIETGGFGNGQFEMTTGSSKNSYIRNGQLYITPTLTREEIPGLDDRSQKVFIYNATGCTYGQTRSDGPITEEKTLKACSVVANTSTGIIVPPVQSARLSTRNFASIRYGKVEVRAKLPTGDWLWPAIWMLPRDNTYGEWPISGEIDIMEARGNGPRYPAQGNNVVRGSLNWGPVKFINAVHKTYGWWSQRRSGYNKGFHTYTLEWTEDFMRVYVDSRLHVMLDLKFNKSFFSRGKFPPVVSNGTNGYVQLQDPWAKDGTGNSAPFDQSFYLILNVAVGGTNGWFPDRKGEKPWLDGSTTAMRDFRDRESEWYPTWPQDLAERSMIVDSVKMWQKC